MAPCSPALSVYVHVPFCTDKCLYCDFFSVPRRTVSAGLQSDVVMQTIEEARTLLEVLGPENRIETVFIGGGTPSALPRPLLAALLGFFAGTRCQEWTVEANPETVDGQFLDLCAEAGVTRLSLGIQTLRDSHLRLLRRRATRETTLKGAALVAERWRGELNLDFIAGIPGQTEAEIREDLGLLDRVGPGHVSLYQLTFEQGTPLAALVDTGKIIRDPPEREEGLWFAGREELARRGFRHYEVSNFCRPGKECRHNLRYWRMEPYLGVGPGAVSTLPGWRLQPLAGGSAGPGHIARLSNTKDLEQFVRGREAWWGLETETVSPREFLLETLMMGLRVEEGIEPAAFERRFGASFDELFPGLWARWLSVGWASEAPDRLALSAAGRLMLDGLLKAALDALDEEAAARLRLSWP